MVTAADVATADLAGAVEVVAAEVVAAEVTTVGVADPPARPTGDDVRAADWACRAVTIGGQASSSASIAGRSIQVRRMALYSAAPGGAFSETGPVKPRTTQRTLHTPRLTLVPLGDEHLEHEVELDADPEVMRYLDKGPRDREQVEHFHRLRLAAAHRVPGLGFWAGFLGDDFVGWWILEPPEREDQGPVAGQAELGYRLLPRHWRQGLASEGARELVRHGFEDLGLTRIFAETMTVNAGSRATMTSVGLEYVRTFHQDWDEPIEGTDRGEVEYAITRDRWLARPS